MSDVVDCVRCGLALIQGRCYRCNPVNTLRGDEGYMTTLEAEVERLRAVERAARAIDARHSDLYATDERVTVLHNALAAALTKERSE